MAEKESRVKHTMGGKSKPKKRKKKSAGVHRMEIRHAANGGYIATHKGLEDQAEGEQPEEHPLENIDSLHSHIDEHLAQPPQPMPAQQVAGV